MVSQLAQTNLIVDLIQFLDPCTRSRVSSPDRQCRTLGIAYVVAIRLHHHSLSAQNSLCSFFNSLDPEDNKHNMFVQFGPIHWTPPIAFTHVSSSNSQRWDDFLNKSSCNGMITNHWHRAQSGACYLNRFRRKFPRHIHRKILCRDVKICIL